MPNVAWLIFLNLSSVDLCSNVTLLECINDVIYIDVQFVGADIVLSYVIQALSVSNKDVMGAQLMDDRSCCQCSV